WLAGVRILPNPSSGKTWVELPNRQVKLLRIQVTDMSGRVWQTLENIGAQNRFEIDGTRLPAGVYALRLQTGAESGVALLVIQP
ncbi:MAG: T9SS type A sorting domain-containing protein, partial [Saprospiraceae bacterium]|nr:T9SS type A sorting domain-containing protein [Saprospiraceae bacterium]